MTEASQQNPSTLQTAMRHGAHARRWIISREALMLVIGFGLGVYHEPILQSAVNVGQKIGIVKSSGDPFAAYQARQYAAARRIAAPLADAGDARAQAVLGLVYLNGRAVAQSDDEALKWFRLAADQGDSVGQYYLGQMFSRGQGVPQNFTEAEKWYRLAAEQGEPQAQYSLAVTYAMGDAGDPDNVSAYMWFDLAAARYPKADLRRKNAIIGRELVRNKMSQEQIAEAQQRASDWKPKQP